MGSALCHHSLMLLYLADAAALVAQTLGGIVATQLLDQSAGIARNVARKFDGIDALQDDVVRAHRIGTGERGRAYNISNILSIRLEARPPLEWTLTRQQFEHQHAQRPVVGTNVMAPIQDHLRCNVLRCAAERPRLAAGLQFLGEPEVDQFHVAAVVQQQILRFQIAAQKRKEELR